MAGAVLVDSNVFITLLRQGTDPADHLVDRYEDVYTCGMVRVEVLRGMRSAKARDELAGFFDVMCNVTTDNKLWEEVAATAWEMDRVGAGVCPQDILIACSAMRVGVPVLTDDRHFDRIPGVRVLRFDPGR